MTFYEHPSTFGGLPVVDYDRPGAAAGAGPGPVAWRIDYGDGELSEPTDDDPDPDPFSAFLAEVDPATVTALLTGRSDEEEQEMDTPRGWLLDGADRLTNLRALFLGDIVSEESEVSWIEPTDFTRLFTAYPALRTLRIRSGFQKEGGGAPYLSPVRHDALTELVFESGGLDRSVVLGVSGSALPALRHLELWLGDEEYGNNVMMDDLAPILSGERFGALRRLGLRNAPNADEIAAAVASAPVVARLETLDLSMGTLTDPGAEALLAGQSLTHLTALDLHRHFLSVAMCDRLVAALPTVRVDVSGRTTPVEFRGEHHRYVAVSE